MDEKHPKRRKDKNNPYTLFIKNGKPYVTFKDGQAVQHTLKLDDVMYAVMNSFELDDLSVLNEWDRHIEQSELSEETLERRMLYSPQTVEEEVQRKLRYEQLHKAIDKLPTIQRRRLIRYFFYGHTYEEIAEMEGCSVHSVFVAIERAKEKLKNFLKQV